MSKIKCIIIEDEPLAVKVLSDYISQVPFLELQGTFKDAILATDYLRNHSVDLIFLDIHLPKLKGMAFLKTLKQPPEVIVTTAYHEYALEGYDLCVRDYLLKPFEFERFLVAVNKVRKETIESNEPRDHIFLTVQKKKVKILFSEIVYVESQYDALKDADALVIATEWSEFRTPDFNRIISLLKNKAIFDGRNLFDLKQMEDLGFHYVSIGRRVVNPQ